MNALGAFWHLVNFIAPVLGVAAIGALLAKLIWRRASWRRLAGSASAVGAVVWLACLVTLGQDGRMLGYAALVLAVALTFSLTLPRA